MKLCHPIPSDPSGTLAVQRALMCANQIGKTYCGGKETAYHLTGLYPDWWEGHRFTKPVEWLVGSNTNETAREICQKELFGDPSDDKALGTGAVPKECIGTTTRKPGVPNAFDSVLVKHVSGGWSKASFRAYEQGPKKHMGLRIDGGWLDEEPPDDIWAQYLRATFSTNGILYITFTPEEGITTVVHGFVTDPKPSQALIQAGWEDAPHMTPEMREQKLLTVSAHERDMRTKGIPLMGTGLVFPVLDDDIMVEPFEIPRHWPRICGVDFGWEHPFAAVWMAWDRDSNTVYLYKEFREEKTLMGVHSAVINEAGPWIPVAWPHDGMKKDPKSGKALANIYRDPPYNVNMLPNMFSNPPDPGKKEGTGGQGVEVGVLKIMEAMEMGEFKVFNTLTKWFEEKRMYHRKDGQIVKLMDDLMSATRYGYMSLRFACTQPVPRRRASGERGLRNW